MTKSDPIFELIHSLGSNEKRAFKLYSKISFGDTNYLKLYGIFDSMEVYSEETVALKAKKSKFNLAYEKHYLQSRILRFLRDSNNKPTAITEIHEILKNLEILWNRHQYQLFSSQLDKAISICEKFELFSYHIILLDYKQRLNQVQSKFNLEALAEISLKNKELREKIFFIDLVRQLGGLIFFLLQQKSLSAIKSKLHKSLKQLEKLMASNVSEINFHSQSYAFIILSYGYYYLGQTEKAYTFTKQLYGIFKLKPYLKQEFPVNYFSTLTNHIQYSFVLNNINDSLFFLNELKKFVTEIPPFFKVSAEIYKTVYIFFYETNILIRLNKQTDLYKSAKEYETYLSKNNHLLLRRNVLNNFLQLGRAYFSCKKYKEAIQCFSKIINSNTTILKIEFIISSYLFTIAIHFEKGNDDLVANYSSKMNSIMIEKQFDDEFASQFSSILNKSKNIAERKKEWKNGLKQKFEKHITNINFHYQELVNWYTNQLYK